MSVTEESRYTQKDLKQEVTEKKDVQPRSFISKKTGLLINCVFITSVLIFFAFSLFLNSCSNSSLQSHHSDTHQTANYEYSGFLNHEGENFDFKQDIKHKRDSKSSGSSSKKSHKATKPLDEPAIRFLLVLGGFVFLNMIAICIHHLFLKATRSEKSYRTIEQNISPF